MQSGGNNGGVIAEQAVAGPQVFREVTEVPVLNTVFLPMHHQQARGIAPIGRLLRDKLFWQRVVEERSQHALER